MVMVIALNIDFIWLFKLSRRRAVCATATAMRFFASLPIIVLLNIFNFTFSHFQFEETHRMSCTHCEYIAEHKFCVSTRS